MGKGGEEAYILGCHRTSLVNERRIILHDPLCHKVVELSKTCPSVLGCPHRTAERTARRYLLSPARSRYRLQNGRVPKFLLILDKSDLADVNLHINL